MTPVPERVDCKGCGRAVNVAGRAWKSWFRCAACGRVHILRESVADFRYDDRYRRTEERKRIVFVVVAFLMSTLGGWIITREIGRAWLVYGVEWVSAALICAVLYWMARRTQDLLLMAGVLSLLFAVRRIGLLAMVANLGYPPYARFPYVMLATSAVCFAAVAYQRRFIEAV